MKIPDAMSQLRSADPIGGNDYRDAHTSADAQGLLEQIASEEPAPDLLRMPDRVAGNRVVGNRVAGNRVLGTMVAAVAVLIAVGVASMLVVRSLDASGAKPAPPAATAAPSVKPVIFYVTKSGDPHFAATITVLDQALASAPMLPGAKPLTQPPLGWLNGGLSTPSYTDLLTPKAYDMSGGTWWTAPGTVDAAFTYFQALNMKSLRLTPGEIADSGYRAGSTTAVTELSKFLPSGLAHNALDLTYLIEKTSTGVAIRVNASTQWLPSHPSAAYLPATVSSVNVAIYGKSVVRRSLSAPAIATIAATLNNLTGATSNQASCYSAGLIGKDAMSFVAVGRTTSIFIDPGCDYVSVSRPGSAKIVLLGGHLLDSVIRQTLGLPQNTGH